MQFRPAIAAREFRRLSPERVIAHALALRAEGVEWSQSHIPVGHVRKAADVREDTLGQGLGVAGYAAYWQGDPKMFADIVSTASLLGASTIRLGAVAVAHQTSRSLGAVRQALDVATNAGITVSIWYFPASFDATLRLLDEVAHPALRLYWRARYGWKDADAESPFQGLRFCVANVSPAELIQSEGGRVSEAVLRGRILTETKGSPRYTIFDAAPHGTSIYLASKAGACL